MEEPWIQHRRGHIQCVGAASPPLHVALKYPPTGIVRGRSGGHQLVSASVVCCMMISSQLRDGMDKESLTALLRHGVAMAGEWS